MPPTAGRRTLVVDDEPDLRTLLRLVLERSGRYEVVAEAGDGGVAIELAQVHRPDVVLLDLSMPRMDGLEALPKLRRIVPDARLVVLSGYAANGAADPARGAGADAYLEKGLTPGALLDAIDAAARRPGEEEQDHAGPMHRARPDPRPPSSAEIVARLAHDVRTPLTTAMGALEVLQHHLPPDVDPDVQRLIVRAGASLERVERTLGSTLEHARTGAVTLEPREVRLGPVLRELVETIPDASRRVQLTGDLGLRAFVDETALQRVLTNLLENALRYSDDAVEVNLWRDGPTAGMEIRDRGPGLGPGADELFEPFVRGSAASGTAGSGLGLATAADLVRRMRGDLSAHEDDGGGAAFTVTLPAG